MYLFTGSNVFGQWYGCNEDVIDEFRSFDEEQEASDNFIVKNAILDHIGWSHNIFRYNNKFFIVGDYKSSGESLEVMNLPKECSNLSNVILVSDDYNFILVDKDTCTIWSVNMETKSWKTTKLSTEVPLSKESKRSKKQDHISKCVAAHGLVMFLTNERLVYSGLLPSLIDTSHCVGIPVDIQCGYEHHMLLTDAGRVYTWGNGWRLQLGHGDVSTLNTPTEVEALSGIKIIQIAAGGWHSLALSEYGDLYAWGWNDTGQLGVKENSNNESLQSYSLPTLVDLFEDGGSEVNIDIKDMACGSRHSAILLEDDTVWTSGNNKYGQLGLSKELYHNIHNFKKSYALSCSSRLMCGKWSTVVVK